MKLIKFVFAVLVFFVLVPMHGMQSFLQANEAYQSGDLDQAITLYESIHHKGEAVWFNLAMVYLQKRDYVSALYALLNAEKQATWQTFDDIVHYIGLVKELLCYQDRNAPLLQLLRKITKIGSLRAWQFLLMGLFVMMAGSFFFIKRRTKVIKGMYGASVVLFMFAAFLLLMKYQLLHEKIAIVMSETSSLAGPDEHFQQQEFLPQATVVTLLREKDDWLYIKHDNKLGWIAKQAVRIIAAPE